MPLKVDLRFVCACGVDSLVTAQINCGLKTNLFLFLNRDGVVLKMWFPLEVRARVVCPPLQRRKSARG